ncbi:CocE/NonD family hydrolase [Halobacillus amylolyticus]|uniref:CocE/NonD family hydrolase n=1 Tax=Halobacillus amylolyticus TaxID=2932259 RepID=UPI002113185D|nr:CocE/NonD family hydrolase [Halobacillus amylolyticus]
MQENERIIVQKDVSCTLRDGTILYANIYRPSVRGSYSVLLTRHPYNKNLPDFSHRYVDPFRLVEAGFIVIIQDVRGRFASEGYDIVEWASSTAL